MPRPPSIRWIAALAAYIVSLALAQSLYATGWIVPETDDGGGGDWANPGRAHNGDVVDYAGDTSPGVGIYGSFLTFTYASPHYCNKLRVYSDFGAPAVDSVDIDIHSTTSGWIDLIDSGTPPEFGVISNDSWYEKAFPADWIDQIRFRYHFTATGWVYWLFEIQLYETGVVGVPTCDTQDPASVEETTALIHGLVTNDGNETCQSRFEYGLTSSYTDSTAWTGSLATGEVSTALLTGLTTGMTYHFRAQVKNSAGISSGADKTFTTGPPGTGWIWPTGSTSDPDANPWLDQQQGYDDNQLTWARKYHPNNDPQWTIFLNLTHSEMSVDGFRFTARGGAEIDQADVDLQYVSDGAYHDTWQGAFTDKQWLTQYFAPVQITGARISLHLTSTSYGMDVQLYEFQFHSIRTVTIEGTRDVTTAPVTLAVGGTVVATFPGDGAANFSFTADVGAGDEILVFYNDGSTYGVVATTGTDDDITDLNLVSDTLVLRSDNGGSLTNADLAAARPANPAGANVPYTAAGSDVTVSSGIDVQVPTGHSFDVGADTLTIDGGDLAVDGTFTGSTGTLTTNNGVGISGTGSIALPNVNIASGALTGHATSMTVIGDWDNNGAFTHNSGTVVFAGTTTIGGAVTTTFNHVTITSAGTLTGSGGTMNVVGNFTNDGTFDANGGTIGFTGTTTLGGTAATTLNDVTVSGTLTPPAGTLTVLGDWDATGGTVAAAAGTVLFAGAGTSHISGSITFHNLSCSTPGKTLEFATGTTQTVNGTLTLTGSSSSHITLQGSGAATWSIDFPNGDQFASYADVQWSDALTHTVTVTAGNDQNNNNANWVFTTDRYWVGGAGNWSDPTNAHWAPGSGASPDGLGPPGATQRAIFDSQSGAGTVTLDVAVDALGILMSDPNSIAIQQGANPVDIGAAGFGQAAGTFTGSAATVDINGPFVVSGGTFAAPSGALELSGSVTHNGGTFDSNGGTVTFDGTTTLTPSVATSLNNVVITGTLTLPDNNTNLSVAGDWSNSGTFTPGAGTARVTFSGTTAMSGSSTTTFRNVVISGSLTAPPSGDLIVLGNWSNNGTFDVNSCTVTFGGTTTVSGSSSTAFGSVTIGNGGTLTGHATQMNVAGHWVNNGSFVHNGGTVEFDGDTTVSGTAITTFKNVTITGDLTGHAGTMSVAGNWTNNGTFAPNGGTLVFNGTGTVGGANPTSFNHVTIWGTLTGTAGTMNVAGNWVNNGTFNHSSGTVGFNGTSTISGTAATTLNNVTMSGTSLTAPPGILTVQGNWDLAAGTFNHNGGTVVFSGAGTSVFSGSSAFNNLTCTTPGKTLQFDAGTTQTVNGTLTLTGTSLSHIVLTGSGTWYLNSPNGPQDVSFVNVEYSDAQGHDITDGGGTDLLNNDNASPSPHWVFGTDRYWVGGSGNWSDTSHWALSSGATSGPNAPPQTVPDSAMRAVFDGNSGAGTVTIDANVNVKGLAMRSGTALTLQQQAGQTVQIGTVGFAQDGGTFAGGADAVQVNGPFELGGGTFTATSGTLTLGNDFAHTGGAFTHNSGTVAFSGATTMTDTVGDSFNNVTIQATGNVTASATLKVAGAWQNDGTFAPNGGTVEFNGVSTIGGSTAAVFDSVTVSGTLTAPVGTLTVQGNWANTGTFTNNGGTVEFAGTAASVSQISGLTTFNNLSCTVPGKILEFAGGTTQTINGTFTVTGTGASHIVLRGTAAATWYIAFPNGAQTVDDADVQWSDALNNTVTDRNGTDLGYNNALAPNWVFEKDRYWVGGAGNWNQSAHWAGSSGGAGGIGVPTANDRAIFDANSGSGTVAVDSLIEVRGLTLDGSAITVTQGAFPMTVGATGYSQSAGTFVGGTDMMAVTGPFQLSGGVFTSTASTLTLSGDFEHTGGGANSFRHNNGTVVIAGAPTAVTDSVSDPFYNLTVSGALTAPAGILNVVRNFVNNGTFTHNGGTVAFNGTTAMTLAAATTFNNITIGGALTAPANANFLVAGDWQNNGTFTAGTGTVTFNGTTVISGTSYASAALSTTSLFYNVTVSGALTAPAGYLTVRRTWNRTGGTFDPNGGTFVAAGTGALTLWGDTTFNNFRCNTGGKAIAFRFLSNQTVNGTFDVSGVAGSNVVLQRSGGAGVQQWSLTLSAPQSVSYITVSNSNASLAVTVAGGTNGGNNVNWFFATDRYWVNGAGDWSDPTNAHWSAVSNGAPDAAGPPGPTERAVFDNNSGAVNCAIDAAVNCNGILIRPANNAVTITNAAGNPIALGTAGYTQTRTGTAVISVSCGAPAGGMTVSGPFLQTIGTFTAPSTTLTLNDDVSVNGGTFTHNSGTVTFNGTTVLTLGVATTFNHVIISGALVAPANANFRVAGNWQNNGTFTHSNGTVVFAGTSAMSGASATSFRGVTINTGCNLTGPLSANINVAGNFTTTGTGTFTHNGGTVTFNGTTTLALGAANTFSDVVIAGALTAPNNTNFRVAGNWQNDGTFNAGTGTVTFVGTTAMTGASTTSFRNVTISATGALTAPLNANVNVAGNFANSGPFAPNGGTVTFTGTTTLTPSVATTLNNVIIAGTLTVPNNNTNLSVAGDWTNNGTFNAGTGTARVTFSGATAMSGTSTTTFRNVAISGTLTAPLSANLIVLGNWTSNGTFIPNGGTVTFNGATTLSGTPAGGHSFNDIAVNATRTLTLPAGGTVNVAGDWLVDGTVTPSTSTVTFNGATALTGAGVKAFYHVAITGALTAPADVMTVNGNWSLSGGAFDANGGVVVFAGSTGAGNARTLSGDTTFYRLNCSTAGKYLNFTAGSTQTVTGALELTGVLGTNIVLRSTTPGVAPRWNITVPASQTVTAVTVGDSNASQEIDVAGGAESPAGSTTNWNFLQDRYWVGGIGSWSETAHWSLTSGGAGGQSVPDTTQRAVFNANSGGGTCTIDMDVVCNGIVLSGTATVVTNAANNRGITLGSAGFQQTSSTFTSGAGAMAVDGLFRLTGGIFQATTATAPGMTLNSDFTRTAGTFTHNSGTITFDGDTVMALSSATTFGNVAVTGQLTAPSNAYFLVAGNWRDDGTFNHNSGTVVFAGTTTMSGSATTSFRNVTVNAGCTLTGPAGTVNVAGDWANNGTFTHGNSTIVFDGTTTLSGTAYANAASAALNPFYGVTITGTLAAPVFVSIAGDWTNNGTFTHNNRTVVFSGSSQVLGTTTTGFYNLTVDGALTGHPNQINIARVWTNNGTFNHGSGTVAFNGTTSITGGSTTTFNNLSILGGTLTGPAAGTVNVAGNWLNNGTFTHNNSTVAFTGTTAITGTAYASAANASTRPFYNLIVSGAVTAPLYLYVVRDWTNNGTFSHNSGTIYFNGTSAMGGTSVTSFRNVIINATRTLTGPAGDMNVAGNWTRNGTFNHNNGTLVFNGATTLAPATGHAFNNVTIAFGSSLAAAAAGAIGVAGNWTNDGTFTASTSTVTFNTNSTLSGTTHASAAASATSAFHSVAITGILTAPAGYLTVNRNWTRTGTFNHGGGTVVFAGATGAANSSILAGNTEFNDFRCATPGKYLDFTAGSTQTVDGTFDVYGATGTLVYLRASGAGTWYIDFPNSTQDVSYVNVSNSDALGHDVTASGSTNGGGNDNAAASPHWVFATDRYWFGGSGTWNSTTNWSPTSGGPSDGGGPPGATQRAIFNAASGGAGSVCTVDAPGVDCLGIVMVTTNVTITNVANNQPIVLGATGLEQNNSTFACGTGAVTVNGPFRLTGGTFNTTTAAAPGMTVNGDFTRTGGTFNAGTGTVTFGGSTVLSLNAAVTFNDVVIAGTLTAPANANFIVAGNWTNDGTFAHSNGTVVFNGTTAVTGTAYSTPALSATNAFRNVTLTGTLTAPPAETMTVAGNWTNNGTFTHNGGTVVFNGTTAVTGTAYSTPALSATNAFYSVTLNGTLTAPPAGSSVTVGGNWDGTAGTFVHNNGKVLFNGSAAQDVATGGAWDGSANNTKSNWYALEVTNTSVGGVTFSTGFKTAKFTANTSALAAGINLFFEYQDEVVNVFEITAPYGLVLRGTAARLVTLAMHNGTSGTDQWEIVPVPDDNSWTVDYVDVTDSVNSARNPINPANSTDNGNTLNWFSATPTLVSLGDFAALGRHGEVQLAWTTASEMNNAGFNLYRSLTPDGDFARLNALLIPGLGTSTRGRTYVYTDRPVQDGLTYYYTLESVEFDGATETFGPVTAHPGLDSDGDGMTDDWEQFFGLDPNDDDSAADADDDGVSNLAEYLAGTAPAITLAERQATERSTVYVPQPGTSGVYKILVRDTGIFQVTGTELQDAKLELDGVVPANLRLYNNGTEVPIRVLGGEDGTLDEVDLIEFYGEGLNTTFTDTNVYWLYVADTPGLKMTEIPDAGSGTNLTEFDETLLIEQNEFYNSELPDETPDDDHWFFLDALIANSAETLTVPLELPGLVDGGGTVTVAVALRGTSAGPFQVRLELNGIELGTGAWADRAQHTFEADANVSNVSNSLTLHLESGPEVLLNWIEVTYPRRMVAADDSLTVTVPSASGTPRLTVTGFSSNAIEIYHIAGPAAVRHIVGTAPDGGAVTVALAAAPGDRLLAVGPAAVHAPLAVVQDESSNLRAADNAADYIIICYDEFYDTVQPLAAARAAQGMRVKTVKLTDVYDDFSYGIVTPYAIRDFLAYARGNWQAPAPQFVLLVGDSTYDYRDYEGWHEPVYMPAKMLHSMDFGEVPCDNWFVCLDGGDDFTPDMAIGRFPVRSTAETETLVSKTLAYERLADASPWTRRVLLVADDDDPNFQSMCEAVAANLPSSYETQRAYQGPTSDPSTFTNTVLDAIDQGALLTHYAGHGSSARWAAAPRTILTPPDLGSLANAGAPTIVITPTCENGYFVMPSAWGVAPYGQWEWQCIAEAFLRRDASGAVACFSPSGISAPSAQRTLIDALIQAVFVEDTWQLGPAVTRAKQRAAAELGSEARNVVDTFILFGDPALTLRRWPGYTVLPRVTRTSPASDAVQVGVSDRIRIAFNVAMDPFMTRNALDIDPYVPGTVWWEDNTLVFAPDTPFEFDTTYTVRVAGTARALNGTATLDGNLDGTEQGSPDDDYQFAFTTEGILSLTLSPGWNLVGVPVDTDTTAGELFNDLQPRVIWAYDESLQAYRRVEDGDPMAGKEGYWIYSPSSVTSCPVTGMRIPGLTTLRKGWNLVSPGAVCPRPALEIVPTAWWWDPISQAYRSVGEGELLLPGRGYWLLTNREFQVDLE